VVFVFTHSDIIVMGEWGLFICDDLALFMDYGWLSLSEGNGIMVR
jgi:ATP:corrinoid adenosyltransferase